jgi:hypothetical protein
VNTPVVAVNAPTDTAPLNAALVPVSAPVSVAPAALIVDEKLAAVPVIVPLKVVAPNVREPAVDVSHR